MATEKSTVTALASFLYETNLVDKFKKCFEEVTSKDENFQKMLYELSSSEYEKCQLSECLIKRMIESNKDYEFDKMKDELFKKFNAMLNEMMKHSKEDKRQ